MTCVVLAAGYATRLHPLTENFPKPLLEVKSKTILDWLLDNIDATGEIDSYVIATNGKYALHFTEWANKSIHKTTIVNNGTLTNETRLGAVKDLWFAISSLRLSGDLLVIAGDNLLDFSLAGFIRYARSKKTSCVMRYFESDPTKLKKSGVIQTDDNDRIISMQEKPENPASHWLTPPFYFLTESDAALIPRAIKDGCPTDAPGSFIAWLCRQSPVHAMIMPGKRHDIGDIQSYEEAKAGYFGIKYTHADIALPRPSNGASGEIRHHPDMIYQVGN
ncbi:MAG: sugar phosphate nucleotidyltransferase [Defluviitaleaceae bacterium]|nr:sugar phosphate nucleotidyltransferase [Defluviitaleaceae bacterium]